MINIAKLLRNASEGMKLYSPLFGEVKFKYVDDSKFGIVVEDTKGCCRSFDKYGRYFTIYDNAECLLFPSKDYHTWQGWTPCIEPKFKVGDWVVFNNNHNSIYQISKVKDTFYILLHICDGSMPLSFSQEWLIRPWTIQDAKAGDVLAVESIDSYSSQFVAIYKERGLNFFNSYCCIGFDGKFHESESGHSTEKIHPATKEQRDLLFKKMKEEGYAWDEKKKELCKTIEPQFKVGDEIKTGNTIETIAEVDHATRSYCCESGRTIWFENQDLWHLAPKPHYDIANFKPFDKVLVRCGNDEEWMIEFYCKYDTLVHTSPHMDYPFMGIGDSYSQCIPFNEETKHLLGTTDMPSEEFINW